MTPLKDLLDAVRKSVPPEAWSRGVQLARAGAVVEGRIEEDRVEVLVRTRGGLYCPKVTLFPADADWECSCTKGRAVCEHVAAAAIALHRAESGDAPRTVRETPGRVGYRLSRRPGGITLERMVVTAASERRLETSLAAVASGRADGPTFVGTRQDLDIEVLLGAHRAGPVPRALLARLLPSLSGCDDVTLDGRPVRVSVAPVTPVARVEDQGDGFRLVVAADPSVTELLAPGFVLCGDCLRPVDDTRLTGREAHELPSGKHFGPQDVAELVTEVLPALAARIPVEIATSRLPRAVSEPPRVRFELEREGLSLAVLPTIVYGDPPRARVDGGRLVHLGGSIPLRDERREREIVRRLGRELDLAPGIRSRFDGEAAVRAAEIIRRWIGGGSSDDEPLRFFRPTAPLEPRVRLGTDGTLDVEFAVPGGAAGREGRADVGVVLGAWRSGANWVPLLDGGWSPLPHEWLSRFGHLVADLLAAREASGRLPACAGPDVARLCDEMGLDPPAGIETLASIARRFEGLPPAEIPADLTATLRPYQRCGVDWLVFLSKTGMGALLADDMGLGKTLQALCAIRGRTLVVCPTSVLHNWVAEARRFRPGLRVALYHGERRALDRAADLVVTSYAILRLDAEALGQERWDSLVLDEAQTVKNPDSQVARAAFSLDARFRIALSGTPVENRLEELWSQMHFLNRGLLGSRDDFDERYARPIASGDGEAAGRLRDRIRPFMLRRLKRDVAPELPLRTDVVLRCELSEDEREVYDTVRAATRAEVIEKLQVGGGVFAALEALLRLRQAACHVGLVPGRSASTSSKLEMLLGALESAVADGHKSLVFSQWTSLLDLMEPHLLAASIPFTRLDGSTRDRAAVVSRFGEEDGPPVMLVSLRAGGQGLNLVAADHVFLVDPWWNPAVEDQAADRAHRIGQQRPVLVYRLVARDTVEERILALQASKRELADAALAGSAGAASLTRQDLLSLLD